MWIKDKRILALDGSSTKTGYSIFDKGNLVSSGIIDISKSDKSSLIRCKHLFHKLIALALENKIELIVYEQQLRFAVAGTYALISSAYVTATIELATEVLGIKCVSIPIKTWKAESGINTKGRINQKKQAKELVKNYFNKDVSSDDEADSILIGYSFVK